MTLRSFLSVIAIGFGITVGATEANWNLRQLAQGSNSLLVEIDKVPDQKKEKCNLDADAKNQMSQNLKILIDERIKKISHRKSVIVQLLKNCSADCTCDIYDYALEKITGDETLSSGKKFSSEQRLACAKKQPEFCDSKLYRALR